MRQTFAVLLLLSGCECGGVSGMPDGSLADSGEPARTDAAPTDSARPDTGPPPPPPDVHVRITSDNAYGFGYGSAAGLANYFEGREAISSSEIFICSATCEACPDACDVFGTCNDDGLGPETYVVPGADTNAGDFLYIVTWSDDAVTQGLLGQFVADIPGGRVIYTGDAGWEVCATGMDFDVPSGGPSRELIDEQIVACGAGAGPSGGWLGTTPRGSMVLAVGENNVEGTEGDFPGTCTDATRGDHIRSEARWMWFEDDMNDARTPFRSDGEPHGEFLIFRLRIQDLLI